MHRYNAEGLGGLVKRRVAQRPRRLTPGQMTALAGWVEAGPDPEQDGLVRWRRRDLQARIAVEFGVTLHERTAGKYVAASNWRQATGGARLSAAAGRARSTPGRTPKPRRRSKNFPEAVAAQGNRVWPKCLLTD